MRAQISSFRRATKRAAEGRPFLDTSDLEVVPDPKADLIEGGIADARLRRAFEYGARERVLRQHAPVIIQQVGQIIYDYEN